MAGIAGQRGFVAILAVVIILVIGMMVATLGQLTSTDNTSGALHEQSMQAYFAAKSGIEFAGFNLGMGTTCGSLPTTEEAVGDGSFTITSGTLYDTTTTLSAAISSSDTVLPVTSLASLASHGLITIGNEDVQYGSTGSNAASCSPTSAPCLRGVVRGHNGSSAAAASSGATVSQLQCVVRATGTVNDAPSATRMLEASFEVANPSSQLAQAMMVYTKGGVQGFSRIWNPLTGGWGAETATLSNGAGSTIQHVALATSRTRDEAMLGMVTTNGRIYLQRWNGPTSAWRGLPNSGTSTQLSSIGTTMTPPQYYSRSVDIRYTSASDKAVIVFDNGGSASPYYRTWDGTTFSGAVITSVGVGAGNTAPNYAVDIPRWIELAADPDEASNEISMIVMQSRQNTPARRAVRAAVYNGTTWSNLNGGNAFDIASDTNLRKAVAVAYEQGSGRTMYAWADNANAGQVDYTVYTGTTQNVAPTSVTIPASTGIGQWVNLAAQPDSNNIMLTLQSANQDLDTLLWDGSAWGGAQPQHSASTQTATEDNSDFVFENHPAAPGWGWLVWADSTGIARRRFEGGTNWSAIQTSTPAGGAPNINDVDLDVNPISGRLVEMLYSTNASTVKGVWTTTRQGAIRDASRKFNPLGWYAPPVTGIATAGLVTGTTGAASPSGSRVAVSVRATGAALIEMQEIFP
jgi:hypothetical protein